MIGSILNDHWGTKSFNGDKFIYSAFLAAILDVNGLTLILMGNLEKNMLGVLSYFTAVAVGWWRGVFRTWLHLKYE